MNKYQEAYEYLLGLLKLEDDIKWPLVNQSMKSFKELVDKEMPKKVFPKWREGYDPKLYYPKSFYCPSCSRQLRRDQSYKCCPKCGQRLDWSY